MGQITTPDGCRVSIGLINEAFPPTAAAAIISAATGQSERAGQPISRFVTSALPLVEQQQRGMMQLIDAPNNTLRLHIVISVSQLTIPRKHQYMTTLSHQRNH